MCCNRVVCVILSLQISKLIITFVLKNVIRVKFHNAGTEEYYRQLQANVNVARNVTGKTFICTYMYHRSLDVLIRINVSLLINSKNVQRKRRVPVASVWSLGSLW